MKNLKTYFIVFSVLFCSAVNAQSFDSLYGSIVSQSSFDTVNNNLITFESLGVKEHGTTPLDNTLNWLISKYSSYGYTDIVVDTFNYSGQDDYNLIVTKQGDLYPNTYVIIDGHYDTKNGTGTNDNGTGVITILEIARLLQNVNTEYSIKFINFSGEEDGLVGSTYYVNNTVTSTNMDIKVLLNIDEVGGTDGMVNNIIVCERDESFPSAANAASALFTDTLATCMELYSTLQTEISNAFSSDYMPFQANNEIITGLYEKNVSPYAHTPFDNLTNMDINYLYEVVKGSIGASLYFAIAYQPVGIEEGSNSLQVKSYPIPTKDILNIDLGDLSEANVKLTLIDVMGKILIQKEMTSKKAQLQLEYFPSGVYTLVIETPKQRITKKIIH